MKKLGDPNVLFGCLMPIKYFTTTHAPFTYFCHNVLLFDTSCLLSLLSYPLNSVTLLKHLQHHFCYAYGLNILPG